MNSVEMMKLVLELAEDVKKLPPSKEREEILKTISSTLLPNLMDVSTAPKANTGLPCPYCHQKLPRITIHRTTDAVVHSWDVLIAIPEAPGHEMRSLAAFLRQTAAP